MAEIPSAVLMDDRSQPDFRARFGILATRAERMSSAVARIRFMGLTLRPEEVDGVAEIRLLLQELNALAASSEAEQVAADPARRSGMERWLQLLRDGRLQLRLAPLAGWNPDFTIFHGHEGEPDALLLGPHWFLRPYPHPGPAFTALFTGPPVATATRRFEAMWKQAHDLRTPMETLLLRALRASTAPVTRPSWVS